jgi:hypothetical protein
MRFGNERHVLARFLVVSFAATLKFAIGRLDK